MYRLLSGSAGSVAFDLVQGSQHVVRVQQLEHFTPDTALRGRHRSGIDAQIEQRRLHPPASDKTHLRVDAGARRRQSKPVISVP